MLKLLILFPLLLAGGAVAFGLMLPLFALLPVLLAIGVGVVAIGLVFSVFGLILRVVLGLLFGAGVLFAGALGFGFLLAGGAAVVAVGFALAHLLLPLLLIAGLIWLIRHHSRPPVALPAPPTPAN